MFLLVPAHPGSPRKRDIKQLLLLLLLVGCSEKYSRKNWAYVAEGRTDSISHWPSSVHQQQMMIHRSQLFLLHMTQTADKVTKWTVASVKVKRLNERQIPGIICRLHQMCNKIKAPLFLWKFSRWIGLASSLLLPLWQKRAFGISGRFLHVTCPLRYPANTEGNTKNDSKLPFSDPLLDSQGVASFTPAFEVNKIHVN